MEYVKFDPLLYSRPKMVRAGWWSCRVYELLVMVSGKYDLRGRFSPKYQDYDWLAREWNYSLGDMTCDSPGGELTPGSSIKYGVDRLFDDEVGLLVREGDDWVIAGWEEFYGRKDFSTTRVRKYRARAAAQNLNADETDETGETPLHTTHTTHTTHPKHEEMTPRWLMWLWNHLTTPPLPKWVAMSSSRATAARLRLKEKPDAEYWNQVIKKINDSDFCKGGGNTGWRADPEFLLRPDSHIKVMEGKYDNRGQAGGTQPLVEHKPGTKLY